MLFILCFLWITIEMNTNKMHIKTSAWLQKVLAFIQNVHILLRIWGAWWQQNKQLCWTQKRRCDTLAINNDAAVAAVPATAINDTDHSLAKILNQKLSKQSSLPGTAIVTHDNPNKEVLGTAAPLYSSTYFSWEKRPRTVHPFGRPVHRVLGDPGVNFQLVRYQVDD